MATSKSIQSIEIQYKLPQGRREIFHVYAANLIDNGKGEGVDLTRFELESKISIGIIYMYF